MSANRYMDKDQLVELISAVGRNVPRFLPTEVAQHWIDKQAELKQALLVAIDPEYKAPAPLVVVVCEVKEAIIRMVGGRTTSEIITASHYYHHDWVGDGTFPMRKYPESTITLGCIDGLDFNRNPRLEEVIGVARRCGLERPLYEDATLFGHQCLERFGDDKYNYFLHEPMSVGEAPRVLVLRAHITKEHDYREIRAERCDGSFGHRGARFWFRKSVVPVNA